MGILLTKMIRVSSKTLKRIEQHKLVPSETNDSVINRAFDIVDSKARIKVEKVYR